MADAIDTACPNCRREIARPLWISNGARVMQGKGAASIQRRENIVDTRCPHCHQEVARPLWISNGARLMRLQTPLSGARSAPSVLRPCPYCSAEFGLRLIRAHIPRCLKRPIERTPEQRFLERKAMGRPAV